MRSILVPTLSLFPLLALATRAPAEADPRSGLALGAGLGLTAASGLEGGTAELDLSGHARAGRWLTPRLALEGRVALDVPPDAADFLRVSAGPGVRLVAGERLTVGATVGLTVTSYAAGPMLGLDATYALVAGGDHALDLLIEVRGHHGNDVTGVLGTAGLGWHVD